ncbi:MAG: SEC-C domain-containing protein [Clostridia bacterium]|nr:SEC-C domain-containing protein [Clostridia bacterium]MCR5693840.1 SEC-C domain-containing protein [Clostridia bacterium]
MGLLTIWQENLDESRHNKEQIDAFIKAYFKKEEDAYAKILEAGETNIKGTVKELGEKYSLEPAEVAAFIDGINTSLEEPADVEALEEDTEVSLSIVWEKLYYNMCKAKAPWLYELEQWDKILDADKRMEIRNRYKKDMQAVSNKVGRNDPCPCGSGKKYKKCCGK